ncbi:MAG: hypothetical protein R3F30_06610 [Planctomycetota bacterium]
MLRPIASLLLLTTLALAQEPKGDTVKVAVKVKSVSGQNVYLDTGRAAGLRAGDRLVLRPAGRHEVFGYVREVSRKHARAILDEPEFVPALDTPGEVVIPKSRLTDGSGGTPDQPERPVPEHPPWPTELPEGRTDVPLLAPVASRRPSDRPFSVHGRAWLGLDASETGIGGTSRFYYGHAGTDMELSNPFEEGGEVRFRGDLYHRRFEATGVTEDETRLRVDRLSYRYGHADDAPWRFQVGRFLQSLAPEFGVVDGAETDVRLGVESRLGLVFGGFPDPESLSRSLDDQQLSVFYRWSPNEDRDLELAGGYQHTWHDGAPDRDLVLLRGFWRGEGGVSVHGAAYIDIYGSNERVESSGVSPTELQASFNWTIDRSNGLSAYLDWFRYPDIYLYGYDQLAPERILDDYVFRWPLSSWHLLTDELRLDLRAVPWKDQDRDGLDLEVRTTVRDWLPADLDLDVTVFRTAGSYQDGWGYRVELHHYGPSHGLDIGYEWADYEFASTPLSGSSSDPQGLWANLRMDLSDFWDLSARLDHRFGGNQDSLSLNLYLQYRF